MSSQRTRVSGWDPFYNITKQKINTNKSKWYTFVSQEFNSMTKKVAIYVSGFYIAYLCLFCFFMFPCIDTFYYFDWSKHLQLSYFDGPPLIAYVIRLTTTIFGHTIFALNFVGVACMIITSALVYKIGALINPKVGIIAALLWLFYPFMTTRAIVINVTYDGLECLFSAAIIYVVLLYLQRKSIYLIYIIGALGGFLLLSKYQGIILLVSLLLLFALNKKYRQIYHTCHIYFAILICLILFSPVLIWNQQHDWASFYFQLHTHLWHQMSQSSNWSDHSGFKGVVFFLWNSFFCATHILVLFLAFIFFIKKPKKETNQNIIFLIHLFICYFIFWLCVSPFGHVALNYLLPLTTILIIITSYYVVKYDFNKPVLWLIPLFLIINTFMMLDRSTDSKFKHQHCMNNTICFDRYIKTNLIKY